MNTRSNKSFVLHFFMLIAGGVSLTACHAPQPVASAELELPLVVQSIQTPEVLADGSIQIDNQYLVQHIGTEGVFILSDGKRARFRMVKAGKRSGGWLSISSGLVGNEKILAGPYDTVFDGSPVSVKEITED